MDPLLSIFVRAFIEVLIEKLLPLVLEELKNQDLDLENEVDELLRFLLSIKAMVEGIELERRQEEIPGATKTWLHLVEKVVYDANDLLDEIAYEIQRVNHVHFSGLRQQLSILSIRRENFKRKASNSLRGIMTKRDGITGDSQTHLNSLRRAGLRNEYWDWGENSLQTDCFLPERVFGRSDDLKAILNLMSVEHSSTDLNRPKFDVISIHGMAGVGKTTLAKMVFNDERVPANRFHVKKWVHTPRNSDVRKLFYSMMESLTGNTCQPLVLNTIQEQLRNLLREKKYLFVLDDMSIDQNNQNYWESLKGLLSVGAYGSKVLVTTRCRSIAPLTWDVVCYQLNTLPHADCRELYKASSVGVHPADPRLKDRIVEKCRGLPMAVKSFSSSLSVKAEGHDQWDNINSLEDKASKHIHREISKTIPTHTRRCFAYCSTFPPGFHLKKEMLIQLWMAQDIVSSEKAGCDAFDYIFNWSLFDYLQDFDYRKTQQTYVMHHWIHSTALLMADGECCAVDQGNNIRNLSSRTRHVSLVGNPNNMMSTVDLSSVYVAKGLYSLLLISYQHMNKVPDDLVMKLPWLRSLDLSNTNIEELPESIGRLKHLRYLALRNTRIKKLPDSVGELYFLQTLGLANCYELTKLPSSLKNLDKLIYLDLQLDDDSQPGALRFMPRGMSKLKGLRTLSRFVASRQRKKHCRVSELETLSDLHGDLCISNLDCVGDPHEAQLANLKNKSFLKVLELQWSTTTLGPRNRAGVEASVLEQLRPHPNLKELRIKGYAGDSFPAWMASPSTFSNIVTVKLIDCKTCAQLPPLGHLPALQHLIIKGMDSVQTIDCSFCRQGETGRFPSLTKMHLENMPNLEEWISQDDTCNLPRLRELIIRKCNNLKQISHSLQSLTKLEILQCSELRGLRRFPSLRSLDVRESGPWIWRSLNCLSSLTSMTLTHLPILVAPIVAMQPLITVRRFEFVSCGTPEYLPDNWLPNGLTHLLIKHCPNLRALPRGLHNHQTLVDLKVQDCEKLESLGGGMRYLVSLQSIHLSDCPLLSCLSRNGLPAGLQLLSVDRCPKLIHWIQDNWSWVAQVPSVLKNGDQIRG
ncbi:hypothetical protein J5N97_014385 [Dioscorea zingiberensis]|uniref:Uncharacterized protein n=1 Tax=Dioscorea zingiberensis TaxID=325984 RepID=A0A9D5CSE5_9LILI|nr:hypothetical protein J5N97_014385 [Dioscorea zingiberensis]